MKICLPFKSSCPKFFQSIVLATALFCFSASKAQTLNAGDLAVIGINALADEVRFVNLVPINAGTVIKITDKGWNNGAWTITTTGDGVVTWTVASYLPAGTVFRLSLGGSDNVPVNNLQNVTTGASLTSATTFSLYTVSDAINLNGEQIIIYQGTDANPLFIYGMNASRVVNLDVNNWQMVITATLVESMLPSQPGSQNSLTPGVNAVGVAPGGLQMDNVQYTGPTSATGKANWLSRFTNTSNWSGDNTGSLAGTIGTSFGTAISLPIKLTSFNAVLQNNDHVQLQWKVAPPEEHARYELQKSKDARTYISVAVIDGTPTRTQFTYTDLSNTGGACYYRLKMTDIDGGTLYSNVAMINSGSKEESLKVYPNPVTRGSILQVNMQYTKVDKLELVNQSGQTVYSQLISGGASIGIQIPSSVSKGNYFVKLSYHQQQVSVAQLDIR